MSATTSTNEHSHQPTTSTTFEKMLIFWTLNLFKNIIIVCSTTREGPKIWVMYCHLFELDSPHTFKGEWKYEFTFSIVMIKIYIN